MKRRTWNVTLVLLLALGLLTACGGESVDTNANASNNSDSEVDASNSSAKPTLQLSVEVEGRQATIFVQTDLIISQNNFGGEKTIGEGHIHVTHNDGEKMALAETPLVLTQLEPGVHNVKVSLHNNDHTPYDVAETIQFTIK